MTYRAAALALILAACSGGSDSDSPAAAREVWLTGYGWAEDVTGPALDQDSATRVEAAFWYDGPSGIVVLATDRFCGLTLEIAGSVPLVPGVSIPSARVDGLRDGTGGLSHSGDLAWPEPPGWTAGNHWVAEGDQDLFAVAVSLSASESRDMHQFVDLIDLDVLPCD